MGVLRQHVDEKEPQFITNSVPKLGGPKGVAEQGSEVFKADTDPFLVNLDEQRQAQRVEQRVDHHRRVNEGGRGQRADDVPSKLGLVLL